ncbi:UDP-N-acetylmuramate:L-alanyl-gamma-D-glutamyl-meso-diaminopimelate ligase [Thiohalocapsa halophila]|uniref:UDP-N-acetylmuramate--L-alanyl-gamma-D-glutamyl-meso-2,6-diaminoheptandioate ligase n=1 Tax=Thiohalocapsa halophila TaxID=69359 RepID=A0ABS1CJ74_9GAMM|nr:UDP-N-acetylmuramate:L-alanyl-gamma-D-glutamyl-meso-diaminopimelate ligase [Thiohalocapsa halophila]MBK1631753.1 UDP-N-acetylmuramate:L-alanyl-gamma-D-glutamyl-meso-diaminopimelate ligase [Thiohalocapsa halophila]
MHLHILGICGTFMGGVALLARALGHRVTGSDANVYPPMSTQLAAAGIELMQGYDASHLQPAPDVVVVGNAMTRGMPAVEYMLDAGLPYVSGPQWLAEHLLAGRHVLAVAGTHGKTSTASMLAWVLEDAGLAPGFLIGGVPQDFGVSARLGEGRCFVVEADEYDTAFFDKRSKFVHYRPRTLVVNNLEFDHADIFDDLAMIQRQFHHLVRTVPGTGLIVHPQAEPAVDAVLAMGVWTPTQSTGDGGDWSAEWLSADGSALRVHAPDGPEIGLHWGQTGAHNVQNALSAMAAAAHVGVEPALSAAALGRFAGVKRRMELRGEVAGVRVYDDFAHHPTAIASTLHGLRRRVGEARIIAVLEPRSNTMRLGVHAAALAQSLTAADQVQVYAPADLDWDAAAALAPLGERLRVAGAVAEIVAAVGAEARPGDHVLVMSNGGFGGIHQLLLDALAERA